MFADLKVRRLLLAGGVALTIGLPILACSGTAPTDGATDGTETPAAGPEKKIVGTWRLMPDEPTLRTFKIMDAAMAKNPKKKEKLGNLTAAEQGLYDQIESMKGSDELKMIKAELRFMKDCNLTYTDSQVTVSFGTEKHGPVDYKIVSATNDQLVMEFDPGLDNGTETHTIKWVNDKKGELNIRAGGKDFNPLQIGKK